MHTFLTLCSPYQNQWKLLSWVSQFLQWYIVIVAIPTWVVIVVFLSCTGSKRSLSGNWRHISVSTHRATTSKYIHYTEPINLISSGGRWYETVVLTILMERSGSFSLRATYTGCQPQTQPSSMSNCQSIASEKYAEISYSECLVLALLQKVFVTLNPKTLPTKWSLPKFTFYFCQSFTTAYVHKSKCVAATMWGS